MCSGGPTARTTDPMVSRLEAIHWSNDPFDLPVIEAPKAALEPRHFPQRVEPKCLTNELGQSLGRQRI